MWIDCPTPYSISKGSVKYRPSIYEQHGPLTFCPMLSEISSEDLTTCTEDIYFDIFENVNIFDEVRGLVSKGIYTQYHNHP